MQLFHSSQVRGPRPGQSGGQGFSPAGQTQARGRGVLAAAWPLCRGVSTLERECRHWRFAPAAQAAPERAICFSGLISVILAFTRVARYFGVQAPKHSLLCFMLKVSHTAVFLRKHLCQNLSCHSVSKLH